MEELIQKWAARDALYAAARESLSEVQADIIRRWRRLEAGEVEPKHMRKAAYMAASRWMPPALGAW
jgi:hypothetical protein